MARQRQKIEVNALQEGMFVSDLDRPWHQTPFPLQGFYIKQDDDIKALADYCKFVYIDVLKQRAKSAYAKHATGSQSGKKKDRSTKGAQDGTQALKLPPITIKHPKYYEVQNTLVKEVSKVRKLHEHVYDAIGEVFSAVQEGDPVSIKETEQVADGMVDSVVRNPDALVWLAKMREQDVHAYQHGIRSAIWSLVFGRHLGLDRKALKTLAMGVLLMQVGKLKLDIATVADAEKGQSEARQHYEGYVLEGLAMLRDVEGLPKGVLTIAEYHQERHNGSGFPKGVTGDRIPLLAKIAGLVDAYQNMIDPRNEEDQGLSPLEAVGKLYEMRNISFQQDLVERFIEAIGVYPTGTLVLLNSGEVAIVTGHNQDRRLMPKVMVVRSADAQLLKNARVVDLKEYNAERAKDDMLLIRDSLPKGAYGIDEKRYLLSGASSKWSLRHLAGSLMAG